MTTLFIVECVVLVGAVVMAIVGTALFLQGELPKKKEKKAQQTLLPQEQFAEEMIKEAVERRKSEIMQESLAQPLTADCLLDKKIKRCGRTAVASFWQNDYE